MSSGSASVPHNREGTTLTLLSWMTVESLLSSLAFSFIFLTPCLLAHQIIVFNDCQEP